MRTLRLFSQMSEQAERKSIKEFSVMNRLHNTQNYSFASSDKHRFSGQTASGLTHHLWNHPQWLRLNEACESAKPPLRQDTPTAPGPQCPGPQARQGGRRQWTGTDVQV